MESFKKKYRELQEERKIHKEDDYNYAAELLKYIYFSNYKFPNYTSLDILIKVYEDQGNKIEHQNRLARYFYNLHLRYFKDDCFSIETMLNVGFKPHQIAYVRWNHKNKHRFAAILLERMQLLPGEEIEHKNPLNFLMSNTSKRHHFTEDDRKELAKNYFHYVLSRETDPNSIRSMREAGFTAKEVYDAGIIYLYFFAESNHPYDAQRMIKIEHLINGGYTKLELQSIIKKQQNRRDDFAKEAHREGNTDVIGSNPEAQGAMHSSLWLNEMKRATGRSRGSKTLLLRDYIDKLYDTKRSNTKKYSFGPFMLRSCRENQIWKNLEKTLNAPWHMLDHLRNYDDKDEFERYFKTEILKVRSKNSSTSRPKVYP